MWPLLSTAYTSIAIIHTISFRKEEPDTPLTNADGLLFILFITNTHAMSASPAIIAFAASNEAKLKAGV